eukprot:12930452-Prorocentrum_lima.AAC.1
MWIDPSMQPQGGSSIPGCLSPHARVRGVRPEESPRLQWVQAWVHLLQFPCRRRQHRWVKEEHTRNRR